MNRFILMSCEGGKAIRRGVESQAESPLDMIVPAIEAVEDDPEIHSVGYGSWPNLCGEIELDAAIINGDTLECGSVGALPASRRPLRVARAVMERLPHVMLVGAGARLFADEIGNPQEEIRSDISRRGFEEWRQKQNSESDSLIDRAWNSCDPITSGGTIVAIAGMGGSLAAGVSTSGWSWKYPGRLGDSPLIGAGIYADSRYGAAGCIGHGELAIRVVAARSVTLYLKMGMELKAAVREVVDDIRYLPRKIKGLITIYAVNKSGDYYVARVADRNADAGRVFFSEGRQIVESRAETFLW